VSLCLFALVACGEDSTTAPTPRETEWTPSGLRGGRVTGFAAAGDIVYASGWGGMFKSTHGDATWSTSNSGLDGSSLLDVATDGPNTIAPTSTSIYRSTDQGATWTGYNTVGARRIAIRGEVVLAGGYSGVQRSLDGGVTWAASDIGIAFATSWMMAAHGNSFFTSTNTSGFKLLRTDDDGATWTNLSDALPSTTYPVDLASDGSAVYVTAGGLFRSTDNGATWTPLDVGPTPTAVAVTTSAILAGGVAGLVRSTDNGVTWTSIGAALGEDVAELESQDDVLLAASGPGAIFRSTDQGDTWTPLREAGIYTYGLGVRGQTLIVLHEEEFSLSLDDGATWTTISPDPYFEASSVVFQDDDIFFVAGDLYRTSDNGATFTQLSLGVEEWIS